VSGPHQVQTVPDPKHVDGHAPGPFSLIKCEGLSVFKITNSSSYSSCPRNGVTTLNPTLESLAARTTNGNPTDRKWGWGTGGGAEEGGSGRLVPKGHCQPRGRLSFDALGRWLAVHGLAVFG